MLALGRRPASRRVGEAMRARRACAAGEWSGRASQLSEDHVQWTFIDEIARSHRRSRAGPAACRACPALSGRCPRPPCLPPPRLTRGRSCSSAAARSRSTARRSIDADAFFAMLSRVMPGAAHRGTRCGGRRAFICCCSSTASTASTPGLYLLVRDPAALDRLRAALRPHVRWEPAHDVAAVRRARPRRLPRARPAPQLRSGHRRRRILQPRHDRRLRRAASSEHGPSFYRHLFWESGVVGQVLYLEAEAAGVRAHRHRLLLRRSRCTTCSA